MKKKFLKVFCSVIFASSLFLITACGKKELNEVVSNHNVWNEKFVQANLRTEVEEPTEEELINYKGKSKLDDYIIIDSTDKNGIVVLKNEYGNVGFYSTYSNKFIVKPRYYQKWLDYEIFEFSFISFIKIDYEETTLIVDNIGNVIEEGDYVSNYNISLKPEKVNGIIYLTYSNTLTYENTIYEYNNNGHIQVVNYIPDERPNSSVPEDHDINDFDLGELFVSDFKLDLTKFGFDGYYMNFTLKGNLITIFNQDNKSVISYSLDSDSKPILIGKTLLLQKCKPVSEKSDKYDYFIGDQKYYLETKKVNLLTGKFDDFELNYIIDSYTPYKNEQGEYKYGILNIKQINEYECLESEKTVLVDEDIVIQDNLTGLNVLDFIKFGKGYYNEKNEIIYNNEMKEIAYISDLDPVLYKKSEVILGKRHGRYGVLNSLGKVSIPFEYDNIIIEDGKEIVLANKGNNYYQIRVKSGYIENSYYGVNCREIADGIYAMEGEKEVSFITIDKKLKVDYITNYNYLNCEYKYQGNSDVALTVHYQKIKFFANNIDVYYTFALNDQNVIFGEDTRDELRDVVHEGKTIEDAIPLVLGENKIHTDGSDAYTIFTPSSTGLYLFDGPASIYKVVNEESKEYSIPEDNFLDETTGKEYSRVLFEKGVNYYILLSADEYGDTFYKLNLTLEISSENFENSVNNYTENKLFKYDCSKSEIYKLTTTSNLKVYEKVEGYYYDEADKFKIVNLQKVNNDYIFKMDANNTYYFYTDIGDNINYSLTLAELDNYENSTDNYTENKLFKYDCTKTENYIITTTSNLKVYKKVGYDYEPNSFGNINLQKVNNDYIFKMDAYNTYYFYTDIGDNINYSLNLVVSENFENSTNNYTENKLFKYDCSKFEIYKLTTTSNLKVYRKFTGYNYEPDSFSNIYIQKVNDDYVFTMHANGTYYFYTDIGDNINYSLTLAELDNYENSTDNYTENKLFKYDCSKSEIYKLTTTSNLKVYRKFIGYNYEPDSFNYVYIKKVNEDYVFTMDANNTYYFYTDIGDNINYSLTLAEIDNFENNTNNYTENKLFKYDCSKNSAYKLTTASNLKVYRKFTGYNYDGSDSFKIVNLRKVNDDYVFMMDANSTYYFYTDIGDNINYSLTLVELENFENYKVLNSSSTPFIYNDLDNSYTSNNHSDNTTSYIKINCKIPGILTFNYDISSESGYDKIEIYHGESLLKADSGIKSKMSYSINVNQDDYITIKYHKDSSRSYGNDNCTIYNISLS